MRPRKNSHIIAIGLGISVVLFLLLVNACNAATPTMLVFTWQANPLNTVNGVNMWPPCGTTLITCISGETIEDITVPASPAVVASGISPAVFTYTVSPLPSAGTHNYCLEYNAYDQSGNKTVSSCDQDSVVVPSMTPNHPVDTHAVPTAPSGTAVQPSLMSKIKKALHI